jgi:hypothetical protein
MASSSLRVSGTSYVDTTVAPHTNYSYTVVALDAAGNISPPSAARVGVSRRRSRQNLTLEAGEPSRGRSEQQPTTIPIKRLALARRTPMR